MFKPTCFIDESFSKESINSMIDIQYGSAFNHKTNETENLMLDAYFPPDSDTRDKRPVVVVMHGGGFVGGDKQDADQIKYATELARRGYVVVSINYRMTGESWTWESEKPKYDAQEDFRAAVRYVRSQAQDYRLDTDRIIASGDSAGALSALFMSYAKEA
jgi:acetyl esterase/lipase